MIKCSHLARCTTEQDSTTLFKQFLNLAIYKMRVALDIFRFSKHSQIIKIFHAPMTNGQIAIPCSAKNNAT